MCDPRYTVDSKGSAGAPGLDKSTKQRMCRAGDGVLSVRLDCLLGDSPREYFADIAMEVYEAMEKARLSSLGNQL
jgi:hypothetical protein